MPSSRRPQEPSANKERRWKKLANRNTGRRTTANQSEHNTARRLCPKPFYMVSKSKLLNTVLTRVQPFLNVKMIQQKNNCTFPFFTSLTTFSCIFLEFWAVPSLVYSGFFYLPPNPILCQKKFDPATRSISFWLIKLQWLQSILLSWGENEKEKELSFSFSYILNLQGQGDCDELIKTYKEGGRGSTVGQYVVTCLLLYRISITF